jgi:hypothetical protein
MKTKLFSALILGSLVVGVASPTFADENGDQAESKANVTFKADDEGSTTDPGNPGEPDGPGEPDEGDGDNGNGGPLRIDYVTNINFGEQTISGSNAEYHPLLTPWTHNKGQESEKRVFIPQFVQVTDNRGTNEGWELQVSRSQFAAEGTELTAAELAVSNAEIKKMSDIADGFEPTGKRTFTVPLEEEGAQRVVLAGEDKGMATWGYSFGPAVSADKASTDETERNEDVTLSVPGTTKKLENKQYTSNITWTLVAGEA